MNFFGGFNQTLSILTYAGLVGLILYNYKGATAIIESFFKSAGGYVSDVRGEYHGG